MGTLQEKMEEIREGFEKEAPDDAVAVMHRATEDLRESGILERIPEPGDRLPPFALADTEGRTVRSEERLEEGPLVVTFYRGVW